MSCQNVTQGACNAYRRMIFEDDKQPAGERLGFVLHLGDFVYEVVWYPEDRPQGMYDRRLRDVVRYPHGEKITDFHVPDDGRGLPRALPRLPRGPGPPGRPRALAVRLRVGQPRVLVEGVAEPAEFRRQARPAQTRKAAANQAWFEYQPARVAQPGSPRGDRFDAPQRRRRGDPRIR